MAKVKISKEEKQEMKQEAKHWNRFIAAMKAKGALIMESMSNNQIQADMAQQQVN
jgi:hypothetical protein